MEFERIMEAIECMFRDAVHVDVCELIRLVPGEWPARDPNTFRDVRVESPMGIDELEGINYPTIRQCPLKRAVTFSLVDCLVCDNVDGRLGRSTAAGGTVEIP